jgi:hypothetical protein
MKVFWPAGLVATAKPLAQVEIGLKISPHHLLGVDAAEYSQSAALASGGW